MKKSICMATYNGALFLPQTIPSILPQLDATDEMIIVDDASTDATIAILESFNDSRIKIISNKNNQGVSPSFFKAISNATGAFIFIADQDDIWLEHKVSSVMDIFQTKKISLLVHDGFIFQNGKKANASIFAINKSGKGFLKNLWSDTYVGCCMVMTAEAKKKLMPKKQISGVYYDHYLGLMAEWKKLNVLFLSVPLIKYNRHQETHTNMFKRRNLWRIFKDRIRLLWMLFGNGF